MSDTLNSDGSTTDLTDVTRDYVFLKNMSFTAVIGKDAWGREYKHQPVILSVRVRRNLEAPGKSDNVDQTVSYGQMCKDILGIVDPIYRPYFQSMEDFHESINLVALQKKWGGNRLVVDTILPKGLLRADGGLQLHTEFVEFEESPEYGHCERAVERYILKGLTIPCIIGVNPHERETKQNVVVNLEATLDAMRGQTTLGLDFQSLAEDVTEYVEDSSYETVEKLATQIAELAGNYPIKLVTISIEKPSALAFVEGAGVEITRTFNTDGSMLRA